MACRFKARPYLPLPILNIRLSVMDLGLPANCPCLPKSRVPFSATKVALTASGPWCLHPGGMRCRIEPGTMATQRRIDRSMVRSWTILRVPLRLNGSHILLLALQTDSDQRCSSSSARGNRFSG